MKSIKMRMILNTLAVLVATLHTCHGSSSLQRQSSTGPPPPVQQMILAKNLGDLINIHVITSYDNAGVANMEVLSTEKSSLWFRPLGNEQLRFNQYVEARIESKRAKKPRSDRHAILAQLLRSMYPTLNIQNAHFQVSKARGMGKQVMDNMKVSWDKDHIPPKNLEPQYAIDYDTTALFVDALAGNSDLCGRYAADATFIQQQYKPDYSKEQAYIAHLISKGLVKKLTQQEVDKWTKPIPKSTDIVPATKLHREFISENVFELWQPINTGYAWRDIHKKWATYQQELEEENQKHNTNNQLFDVPKAFKTGPTAEWIDLNAPSFFDKMLSSQISTTALIALTSGLTWDAVTKNMVRGRGNVIYATQESIVRSLIAGLVAPEQYRKLHFGYASTLVVEQYANGVRVLFANVDEMNNLVRPVNVGSDRRQQLVIREPQEKMAFINDVEKLIPSNWGLACKTLAFQDIPTLAGPLKSTGLNLYGANVALPPIQQMTEKDLTDTHAQLIHLYKQRPQYSKPLAADDVGFPGPSKRDTPNVSLLKRDGSGNPIGWA